MRGIGINRRIGVGLLSTRGGGGDTYGDDFVILVDTTKAGSASDTIVIPTNGLGYDCTVDWGDGDTDAYSGTAPAISHTYSEEGEKTIKISGIFPMIYFNGVGDKMKLLKILNWGMYGNGNNSQANTFMGCDNLDFIANDVSILNTNIINGRNMFRDTSILELPATLRLDTMTNGDSMFSGGGLIDLPNGLSLNNLESARYMFYLNYIESIPSTLLLANLKDGTSMFTGSTINTEDYSNLLIRIESNNAKTGVVFHGGNSKYNAAGKVARDQLTLPVIDGGQGWTITDGGLES